MIKYLKFVLVTVVVSSLTACSNYFDAYSADKVFSDPQIIALAEATKAGDTNQIDSILKSGIDIDTTGVDNLTPLYWALTYVTPNDQTKAGFKHLLKLGANSMHIHEPSKLPLLHMAARADDSDYLNLVLEHGKNIAINFTTESGSFQTPMAQAMTARNFKNFETLFNAGANPETKSSDGRTVLEVASMPGTWKYALFLLENGANPFAGNEKTASNPDELPDIVWSLENLYYGDFKLPGKDKIPSDRDKIVEILRSKNIEVFPYYKTEDERYDPRPPLPAGVLEAQQTWNGCNSSYSGRKDYYDEEEFKDVNLYADISPDNYSLEGNQIFGLAMINLKRHSDNGTGVIEAEFYGKDTDLFSNYIYEDRQKKDLHCVTQTRNSYLPNKSQSNNKITETIESIYVINTDTCFKKDGIFRFKEIPFSNCEDFITDAQTYKAFVESH